MHRLPGRIAAVMIGSILVFLVTLGASMLWMARALDLQAWEQSVAQIRDARNNLLEQIRLTAIDYGKWGTAVEEVDAGNIDWTLENIGSSALAGQVVHLAVIWGGRYEEDFGWTDDGVEEPRSGLLAPETLALVEGGLASVPLGAYDATQFFVWREGDLFAIGAARLETLDDPDAETLEDDAAERLLLGRRIGEEELAGIGESFRLSGLGILPEAPAGRPFVPLLGGDGEPIGHLAWDAPQPGGQQLARMLLPLLGVLALITGLAALGILLVRRNAQDLVTAEQSAAVAARTDALTGLPNRLAFNEALAAPARPGERAILFMDVNGFKRINDSIGHAAGDQVVVQLSRRLARLNDEGRMLARVGGDEFVYLITGPEAGARAAATAVEVEQIVAPAFDAQGHQLRLTVAMGHAVQAVDGMAGEDLLQQADLAMYEAKRHRDQGPVAFGTLLEKAMHDAREVERALRRALDRDGEFSIAYQPIAARDGALSRVEALARWTSPDLGVVPPDRFIAVAEQSGLMNRLGGLLLRLICDDLAAYPDLRVSINVSPLQLLAPAFVPDLLAELTRKGIAPARVEIELTECVVVDDARLAALRLRELHAAGFTTALDDFGTGYSSIGYLRQLGFNTLKIDRSFVSGTPGSPERLALVNSMILLAHALGLQVVCEGVETEEEAALLRELGCDLLQGYAIGRPATIGTLAALWLAQPQATVA